MVDEASGIAENCAQLNQQGINKERRMSAVETEYVLVVPTETFREVGYFQGFSHETEKYLDQLLLSEHTSYRARRDMEEDPSFKQLIPYVVFQWTDPAFSRS